MRFLYQDSSGLTQDEITSTAQQLSDYIKYLQSIHSSLTYEAPESSINLPSDTDLLKDVYKLRQEKVSSNLKYVIDIGIGGSNLGTKAVYDAMFGFNDLIEPDRFPKIVFVDTCDGQYLSTIQKFLNKIDDPKQVLINVISKSGTTTETIFNLEIVVQALKDKFPDIHSRVVVTTDANSQLWQMAQERRISLLEIPKNVGGRYSVFSAVGLFPLSLVGVDIQNLRDGATGILSSCLEEDILKNPAVLSAVVLYLNSISGKLINDNFFFHPQLESLGKWYRQLMGESIGKEKDLQGDTVHVGITPTVSIGSTDLHSVGQLYLGGPKDKLTTFISAENGEDVAVGRKLYCEGLGQNLEGKSANQVMNAILEGVKIAYFKKGLPFTQIILSDLQERSLGEFLQFKMVEMMYLGKLFNINTFAQPNVEDYKIETKQILNS